MRWSEFEYVHVIQRFREILEKWWNVSVIFTDELGVIQDTAAKPSSLHSHFIGQALEGRELKGEFVAQMEEVIKTLKHSESRYTEFILNKLGLEVLVLPIQVEGEVIGTVCAIGYSTNKTFDKLSQTLNESLGSTPLSNDIAEFVEKITQFKSVEDMHFVDIVECISKEIQAIYTEIASREQLLSQAQEEDYSHAKYDNIVGQSPIMLKLYDLLERIKPTESTVLIQGENGTGKELIAQSIHYNSSRKSNAFIIQNCSALNDNLLESELFGHVKGAFTGATRDRKGIFEVANKGTLFLDEIGDTSPSMQVKLLRVLQEGVFTPVGSIEPRYTDIRLIAATNKPLQEMVEKNLFREDLYYRLSVINIEAPALRKRVEDIPLLVEYFLHQHNRKNKQHIVITKNAVQKLKSYQWPGNVRELQNEIERACVLCSADGKINFQSLSPKILNNDVDIPEAEVHSKHSSDGFVAGRLKDAVENLERKIILEGLRRTGWNKSKLSKELGISRASLILKAGKYKIDRRRKAG